MTVGIVYFLELVHIHQQIAAGLPLSAALVKFPHVLIQSASVVKTGQTILRYLTFLNTKIHPQQCSNRKRPRGIHGKYFFYQNARSREQKSGGKLPQFSPALRTSGTERTKRGKKKCHHKV